MDRTKITIDAGSLDDLQKLLGTFDENLNIVTAELGVEASVDGVRLKLAGAEESVALAARVLEGMLRLVRAGEPVDKNRIVYCIELAREGNLDNIEEVLTDVVAFTFRGKQIKCKTVGQKRYVDAIKHNTVVFGVGPAGTGKTYLAVCLAVSAYKGKEVEKIILTRPAVEAGEKLGFLPGDLQTKVDPYLRPLYDALQEMFGLETYLKLMEKGIIEVAPLAYMRGRTLDDSFIILDEAQNATPEQMKMFLTRLGFRSKAVVTGDLTQTDLPRGQKSGLSAAVKILAGIEDIGIHYFTERDVVRHRLVQKIIQAYEKYDREQARRENEKKTARHYRAERRGGPGGQN